ncbi:uncharacterized protein LOC141711024 [Apium graveolens]|uniref:uncharacterized protein LOC141711024 n=1 Tax=Apium graveolens TaxID=4045 RepID=UPI003D78E8E1
MIRIGFEKFFWSIDIKWKSGYVLFGDYWLRFVKAALIEVGDTIVFWQTENDCSYGVCVYHRASIYPELYVSGISELPLHFRFLKFVTESAIMNRELELPHVFVKIFGITIRSVVNILVEGTTALYFTFSFSDSKIFGLKEQFKKLQVQKDYIIMFNYLGNSTFSISLYDMYHTNCGQNMRGIFSSELFVGKNSEVQSNNEQISIPENRNMVIEGLVLRSEDSNDSEEYGSATQIEETNKAVGDPPEGVVVHNEEILEFHVVLKKSHIDQQCHEAYLGPNLRKVARKWKKRVRTTLLYGDSRTSVEVLKRGKKCRFGIGWDAFIINNKLEINQHLVFKLMGKLNFTVTLIRA